MGPNIYTKPNLLIKNFLSFEVLFDPNSFDPGCWSRKSSDLRVDTKLKNEITALSGCIDRVLKMMLILDVAESLEKRRKI
jgi:hypothetical protein